MGKIVIIGAGPLGAEVAALLSESASLMGDNLAGYLDEGPKEGRVGDRIGGFFVLGGLKWLGENPGARCVIALPDPDQRRHMADKLEVLDARTTNAIHSSAMIDMGRVRVGTDVIISGGAILTTNITVGNHVYIGPGCTISYGAVLEDFVTLGPGVHVGAGARIREAALVGAGSVIEGNALLAPRVRIAPMTLIRSSDRK